MRDTLDLDFADDVDRLVVLPLHLCGPEEEPVRDAVGGSCPDLHVLLRVGALDVEHLTGAHGHRDRAVWFQPVAMAFKCTKKCTVTSPINCTQDLDALVQGCLTPGTCRSRE